MNFLIASILTFVVSFIFSLAVYFTGGNDIDYLCMLAGYILFQHIYNDLK